MKGAIFDLDGVLVDSEPYWQRGFAEVTNEYCVESGLPDPALTAAQMARFQGGRVNDTLASILASLGHPELAAQESLEQLTGRVIAHVSHAFVAHPTPIESSISVARQLADRGVPLAVASSSAQEFIDAAIKTIGLQDAVSVTQSALGLRHGKPHPEVYQLTLDQLGLEADDVVAIEDSTTGIGSAVRAGIATIWLLQNSTETEAEAIQRLRDTLGSDADAGARVRRITRDLTMADIDAVTATQ